MEETQLTQPRLKQSERRDTRGSECQAGDSPRAAAFTRHTAQRGDGDALPAHGLQHGWTCTLVGSGFLADQGFYEGSHELF